MSASPYGSRRVEVCSSCKSFKRVGEPCGICNGGIVQDFITMADYWMGRNTEYASELTDEIEQNAIRLVNTVNNLIREIAPKLPGFKWKVTSGWRPPSINGKLGGRPLSNHMTGHAIDIADPEGTLDLLLSHDIECLIRHGVAIEDPAATHGWCHIQDVMPKSGKRVFIP